MKNNLSFQSTSGFFQPILNSDKIFQMANSLCQIILLILFLSWILKKLSFFKVHNVISKMKIIDQLSLGKNESIVVVEVETTKLVLGVTNAHITLLHKLPPSLKNEKIKE